MIQRTRLKFRVGPMMNLSGSKFHTHPLPSAAAMLVRFMNAAGTVGAVVWPATYVLIVLVAESAGSVGGGTFAVPPAGVLPGRPMPMTGMTPVAHETSTA